jgi:hypothetical protein
MTEPTQDRGLDDLLMLDGTVLVVDWVANHWVKFVVRLSRHRASVRMASAIR